MTLPTRVIYNPAAGGGRSRRLVEAACRDLPGAEVRHTRGPGDAVNLAADAARAGFAVVVAAGGDGTVHEVANGLLAAGGDAVLGVWPAGSVNDYAHGLGLVGWWRGGRGGPLAAKPIDAGLARAAGRERYFVNNCGVGFNARVGQASERMRWAGRRGRYVAALLGTLVADFATPRLAVRFDDAATTGPTLSVSVNVCKREGGFPVTPAAVPDDGWLDYLHAGGVRRWELVRYLPALMTGRLPSDHPRLRAGRCRSAAVAGEMPLAVHTDGEPFARPADGVREVTVTVLPGRLRVLVPGG